MKRILVAVDEDRQAARVIRSAGQLAKAMQATVVVCHVMPERAYRQIQEQQIQGTAPGDWFSNAFALDFYFKEQSNLAQALTARRFTYDQAERHARCLAQQAAEPLDEWGLMVETKGLVGDPAHEIVTLAKRIKADVIVIGFEALRGLGKLRALGSTSREVMENAPCPVLVVPAELTSENRTREGCREPQAQPL